MYNPATNFCTFPNLCISHPPERSGSKRNRCRLRKPWPEGVKRLNWFDTHSHTSTHANPVISVLTFVRGGRVCLLSSAAGFSLLPAPALSPSHSLALALFTPCLLCSPSEAAPRWSANEQRAERATPSRSPVSLRSSSDSGGVSGQQGEGLIRSQPG